MFSLGKQDFLRKRYQNLPDILTFEVICPDDQANAQGNQKSNRLALMEEQSYSGGGIGDTGRLIRFPVLTFNGKVISRSKDGRVLPYFIDPGLPINPRDQAKLLIRTFYPEPTESDWTVYVNPAKFTRAEYEQIVSCYEVHRQEIENILKTSQINPDWAKDSLAQTSFGFDHRAQRIAHLVYGELPQPQVFSTRSIRSGTIDDNKWISSSTEVLTIRPNGKWQIESNGEHGTLSWGGTVAMGTIKVSGDKLIFNVESLIPPMLDSAKEISNRAYIESFVNDESKKITDFYQISFK
ncbi:hypothetical protein GlitD10_1202 [Gloeomargarita lithophora Alchichica-D10]|uniref:Uncharacterized protein n=2 Tax=Gloeomargarita TaxID=1188227 RepID=A0A1J0AC71_9CYAN|nr:hypothetical protein GlitD10_1202 [Gloeomargarita lithophora Alchichica-D10]